MARAAVTRVAVAAAPTNRRAKSESLPLVHAKADLLVCVLQRAEAVLDHLPVLKHVVAAKIDGKRKHRLEIRVFGKVHPIEHVAQAVKRELSSPICVLLLHESLQLAVKLVLVAE